MGIITATIIYTAIYTAGATLVAVGALCGGVADWTQVARLDGDRPPSYGGAGG